MYRTHFSVVLPVPAGKEAQAKSWRDNYQAAMEKATARLMDYMGNGPAPDVADWIEKFNFTDVQWVDSGIWLHSGDNGEVKAAINVIQDYLTTLEWAGVGIFLGWANTCSSPLSGAFSGGGAVVTRDNMWSNSSYECCAAASRAGIKLLNDTRPT